MKPPDEANTSGGYRPLISLFLLIHLFFVAVALSGNYVASPLIARLLQRFAIYTQLLNLDPNFTPYYLTHATEADVDHFLEVDLREAGSLRIPERGFAASPDYQRQQRLARLMAYVAEDEALAGELARAVGTHVVQQRGGTPSQLRVRRHMLQDWEAIRGGTAEQRDPNSAAYFRTPYAANLVIDSTQRVQVVRVEDTGQVARPGGSPGNGEQ